MENKKYSMKQFLSRIGCVSSWEALCLANNEATEVERFLIKEKTLDNITRNEISSYANKLKEFVVYERSSIGASSATKQRNGIFKRNFNQ